jgi:hypothetical protein
MDHLLDHVLDINELLARVVHLNVSVVYLFAESGGTFSHVLDAGFFLLFVHFSDFVVPVDFLV